MILGQAGGQGSAGGRRGWQAGLAGQGSRYRQCCGWWNKAGHRQPGSRASGQAAGQAGQAGQAGLAAGRQAWGLGLLSVFALCRELSLLSVFQRALLFDNERISRLLTWRSLAVFVKKAYCSACAGWPAGLFFVKDWLFGKDQKGGRPTRFGLWQRSKAKK